MEFKGNANVEELSRRLSGESAHGTIFEAAKFFDAALTSLLGCVDVSTPSARIDEALEWGLLTKNERDDLNTLWDLRGSFAREISLKDLGPRAAAKIRGLKTRRTTSDGRDVGPSFPEPLDQLQYVIGTIAFRLQHRTKPGERSGPLPEPSDTDFDAWPPVTLPG